MRRRTCNAPSAQRNCIGCAALLITGLAIACFGQTDRPASDSAPPRLLLLFDGRVIIGDISEVAGGYSVRRAAGSIVVPFDFVRLTATSLSDAYRKQRDSLENPNAEQHLNLARWCFEHRLSEQAVAELEAALKLEPFRAEARELLQVIEAAESGGTSGRNGPPAEFATETADPLTSAGISSENHLDFVRGIQPLLVNKCGNATCHGSASTNALRLHNVRTGRRHQRVHSDENLATVLRFIDADFPLHSPLLQAPQNVDHPVHRGVFAGALGAQQIELLSDWIHAVAVDRQLAIEQGILESAPAGERAVEQSEFSEPPAPDSARPRIFDVPRDPQDPRSSEVLRDILDEERPDAFDPEEFNRRFHDAEQ